MDRGFFKSLFDFSFSSFITIRVIKVIYALLIAGSALFTLLFIVNGFRVSALFGLFMLLIVAPVLFFLYVILARVYLELVVAIFRIAENTSILAGRGGSLSLAPPPPAPSSPAPPAPPAPDQPPPPPPEPPPTSPGSEPTPEAGAIPLPPAEETPEDVPAPPPARARRQTPLRPRRATSEAPPEPPG